MCCSTRAPTSPSLASFGLGGHTYTLSADDTHLVMADGTQVKTHGSIRSKLRVSSYIGDVRLRVMPLQPSIDVILGMDWLAKHNARSIDNNGKERNQDQTGGCSRNNQDY